MLKSVKQDVGAWIAFLLGVMACVLAISYREMRNEPSGLLTFDVTSTKPGILKIIFTKDGKLTDHGWAVSLLQSKPSRAVTYPLRAGEYDLIGFKPLIEPGGRVTITNLKIISPIGTRTFSEDRFIAISQLDKISAPSGELAIAPVRGATDPFGAFPGLHEMVPVHSFSLSVFLWTAGGKLAAIAVVLSIMYGLSRNLPFSLGLSDEPRPEPGLSSWVGFLAVGVIVLYLRNAHSLFVPVLYAEDGAWGAGLINRGFVDMMLNARSDYFVFGNVLLMAFSQLCNVAFFGHNISYLPHFVSLIATLFYAALAVAPVVLLRDVLRIEARLLLWLLVLLVPLGNSSYEVLGRLVNIGYVFQFIAFCLLVWRHYSLNARCRSHIVATDAMLFLCANTNPLCYPLIACYFCIEAWHYWKTAGYPKSVFWLAQQFNRFTTRSAIVLLVSLFLTGLWMLLRAKSEIFRSESIILSNLPEMIIARIFVYSIIFPAYSQFSNGKSALLLLSGTIVIIWLLMGARRERIVLTSAGCVLIYSAILAVKARPVLTTMLDHYITSSPDRYYFGLTIFVNLVLVSALSAGFRDAKTTWRKVGANALAGGLVGLYLGNGAFVFEFDKPRFEWLPTRSFYDEMKEAYEDGGEGGTYAMTYKVALHPSPWVANFPADYVITSVNGSHYTPKAVVDSLQSFVPAMRPADFALKYDGKVVHKTAGRGREDGLFYVSDGARSLIADVSWLQQRKLSPSEVVEISEEEFAAIRDSGVSLK